MSQIDSYKHKCIGFMRCDFDRSHFPNPENKETVIPIYKLLESTEFGAIGDIIIGDGSGGIPMFTLSTIKNIRFHTLSDFDFEDSINMFKAYWSATDAFILCDGFRKLGWDYQVINIEMWVSIQIVSFLKKEYFEEYKEYFGNEILDYDGSICRMPLDDEERSL